MSVLRLVLMVLLAIAAFPATAHQQSVSYLDATIDDRSGGVDLEIDVAIRELAMTFPLDTDRDEIVTWGELSALRPQLESWVAFGVKLTGFGGDCALTPMGLGIRGYDRGPYAAMRFRARCTTTDGLRLHYGLMFDRDLQHRALVTFRRQGAINNASNNAILRSDARMAELPTDAGTAFVAFLREGIHHILIGYDHLAFLLCLLLPAALLRTNGQWRPVDRFRDAFVHVLGIVTAFTAVHSLTLSAAALGWIVPSSRLVEATIAISVLLAALNNIRPLILRRLWMVGFSFGLIHGFGFAGALSELGLPTGERLTALIGFNLGVEIGQIVVVCATLPILFLLRRKRWYGTIAMPAMSLAIMALAAWWLTERVSG